MSEKEVFIKRLPRHSSSGRNPSRRYRVREFWEDYDCEGRPGGKRLEKFSSKGTRDDPVPSRR